MRSLEVDGLLKIFPSVCALDNVSFHVEPGEVVGIVGPNGAGKTTLIKCILGLELQDKGKIRIFGNDPVIEPEKAKLHISYVPEKPEILSGLTVREHVNFMASAYYATDYDEEATELLKQFDLYEKRHENGHSLSKGQTQKTLIVSAFIHHPVLMFFDEPLLGIDPKGGKLLKDMIRQKRKEGGSVVISSHMLDLIEELSDRILIMDKGKIIASGPLEELKEEASLGSDSTLSEVFLQITEGGLERGVGGEGEEAETGEIDGEIKE